MTGALDGVGTGRGTSRGRMRSSRWLAVTLAVLALGRASPDADARRRSVVCTDGDPLCDLDRACNGVCRVLLDGRVPLAIPLRMRLQRPGRRVRRLGRDLVVARCLPATSPCKPALATGCRADLAAGECAAHAGDYDHRGLNPNPACHCQTEDGGTPCTRDGDCQGMCLAPLGDGDAPFRCSAHVAEFGCFAVLDDRGERQALCVD